MDKTLLRAFFSKLGKLEGKEHLFSTIAYGVAPTLKGLKPSSLISFSAKGKNLYHLWEKYKQDICSSLEVSFFEIKKTKNQQLVLFYNADMLEKLIFSRENMRFLKEMGYGNCKTLEHALQLLKVRFESMCPHEIGIFLGIPLADVCGFIRHKGEKCLLCSYWKVYSDPEGARTLFQGFDRARISVVHSILSPEAPGKIA